MQPPSRFDGVVARFMYYYLQRGYNVDDVLDRATVRYPGVDKERLRHCMRHVIQWSKKKVPVMIMSFRGKRSNDVFPDDYVGDDDKFRMNLGYVDDQGKAHVVSLLVNYREGMSLQEAFDEGRQEAMDRMGVSPKIRELIEEHLEQLKLELLPRLGPVPAFGTGRQEVL